MLDAMAFRKVMGTYPTGVTVVTARDPEGGPVGLTVNSFTSVSLDPPLVLVCIDRSAASHDRLLDAGGFVVNILASDQARIASRFAAEPSGGRSDGVDWHGGPAGAPVLASVSAWLACTLQVAHTAGDHSILLARVDEAGVGSSEALAFCRGSYGAVVR